MLSWSLGKESNYSRELHVIGSDGAEIVKLYFFACILLCVCVGGGGHRYASRYHSCFIILSGMTLCNAFSLHGVNPQKFSLIWRQEAAQNYIMIQSAP